ncbi:MAG: asparagine synthase (glutamine-hydrolyzing) [Flavobacteriales bacterium]|nr:asparagine synthase (glutamine-hydrolyzing) [Flavobacteriales bacterium]
MCGIAGILSVKRAEAQLERMTSQLMHRGPDGFGYFTDSEAGVYLGHRRLKILDLSDQAAQPMTSACGRYVIVYNGEVYNYRELASELDISWRTSCDTEVILEAFCVWGIDVVPRLNGMFAFAIYDKQDRVLTLCRDRMGIKPLYYYQGAGTLAFASELKALMQAEVPATVSMRHIQSFLHMGFVPEPDTVFEKIHKLPAGSVGTWKNGEWNIHSYWDLAAVVTRDLVKDEQQAKAELKKKLYDSVGYRLISDVKVGAFLSGGTDSSLVTAIASELMPGSLNTFSVAFENAPFDESGFARKVADALKTDHHELYVTQREARDLLPDVMAHFDQPFADTSALPFYLVSRYAGNHVTVALSGDGGDELFLGYGLYDWRRRLANPLVWGCRKPLSGMLRNLSHQRYQKAAHLLNCASRKELSDHLFSQEQGFFARKEIHPLLKHAVPDATLPAGHPLKRRLTDCEQQALFDMNGYLKDDLLEKVDMTSMRASLEVRVPLLDHNVVTYAMNLDPSLKVHGRIKKYLLKELLADYLPPELVHRPKWGFSIPLAGWLKGDLSFLIDEYLSDRLLQEVGLFDIQQVKRYVDAFRRGNDYLFHRVWLMIVMQQFLNKVKPELSL